MRSLLSLIVLAAGAAGPLFAQDKLTLDQAVAEALQKNAALLAERSNTAVAEARIITAGLRPNPTLSVSPNHLDLLGTGFNDANKGGPGEATLHADYTLERGGKRDARVAVAQAARSVTGLQFLNAVRAAVLEVQNAFVDVLAAKETLALARQNQEALGRIVEVNTVRQKAGDIAEVELIRSRLAALQYENSVRQAESGVRNALSRLQTRIGRPRPLPSFDVAGDLRRDGAPLDLDALQQAAAAGRPDVRAFYSDVARAAAELRSQLAQAKVDYTFGAEYTRQQQNARANALGFSFTMPLAIYNRNQGEIARAREEERQARLRLQAAQTAVAGEVDVSYQQYLTARELLENIEGNMIQRARDVREITEFSYSRGDATLLELLDAQRAFNETMQAYNEARAEYARSLYLLDSVTGKEVK
jgi:cobalt-zinc-cadmium efflux system outer membrane protein